MEYQQIMTRIKSETRNAGGYFDISDMWNFREQFSFAIPTQEALTEIKDFSKDELILEVGAGIGLWAKLLDCNWCNVIATDPIEPKWCHFKSEYWFYIHILGSVEAIKKYHPKILMMIWPSYAESWTSDALKCFYRSGGNKVIYIGEGYGGCTADTLFHKILNRLFVKVFVIHIPQWFGVHDRLYLYERKAP